MPDATSERNRSKVAKIRRFLADQSITQGERTAAEAALARLTRRLRPVPQPQRPFSTSRRFPMDHPGVRRATPTDDELFARFYDILDRSGVNHG